jgi:selenocysteine lyase/cysteine desulfurase
MVFPMMRQALDAVIPPGPNVVNVPVADVVVVTATPVVVVTGAVVASAGILVQVDALQVIPDGHVFPQVPQLPGLDERS